MKTKVTVLAFLLIASMASAETKPKEEVRTVTQVLDRTIANTEEEFVPAAEAMPEDKFDFAPTNGEFKGVRTFAEQVKHIGFANHLYFGPLMGETIDANSFEENPNGLAALKTKAEIVQYLKDSFALGHRAISGITSENEVTPLPKPVSPFLSTRLAIAIIGAFHPKDHYGQMVEYLRMNGIVPPASRPRPQQQSSQPKPQK